MFKIANYVFHAGVELEIILSIAIFISTSQLVDWISRHLVDSEIVNSGTIKRSWKVIKMDINSAGKFLKVHIKRSFSVRCTPCILKYCLSYWLAERGCLHGSYRLLQFRVFSPAAVSTSMYLRSSGPISDGAWCHFWLCADCRFQRLIIWWSVNCSA